MNTQIIEFGKGNKDTSCDEVKSKTKKMTKTEKWKLWCESIHNGKLHNEFMDKIKERLGVEYVLLNHSWLDYVKIHKSFKDYTEEEIIRIHNRAKWLVENCLQMDYFKCQICGNYSFYVGNKDSERHAEFSFIKNHCHTMSMSTENLGYGSNVDAWLDEDVDYVNLKICDDCLVKAQKKEKDDSGKSPNSKIIV